MNLSMRSILCLQWWMNALSLGLRRQSQPTDVVTLGVTWGYGSGTGAGGSFNLTSPNVVTDAVQLYVWKCIWSFNVLSFGSNWKEMRTLLTTLEIKRIMVHAE